MAGLLGMKDWTASPHSLSTREQLCVITACILLHRVVIERRDSDRSLFKWRVHLAVHKT